MATEKVIRSVGDTMYGNPYYAPPEKPSPIDNLPHSSVWGKLRDLEARVERLERAGLRSD